MPQGPRQNRKKVRDVSKGGGSPEERPYDVSRGQNRYVSFPYLCVERRGGKVT